MVGGDVQLEGRVNADKEVHRLYHQLPQLHGVHQGPGVLPHLHGQHLSATCEGRRLSTWAAAGQVGLKQSFDVVDKCVFHI